MFDITFENKQYSKYTRRVNGTENHPKALLGIKIFKK